MSRDSRKRKPVLRNALTRREKEELVLAALVRRDVFEVLDTAGIDPACFQAAEESIWHFWFAIKHFSDRFSRLPNLQELRLTLDDLVNSDGNRVDDETFEEIEELLLDVAERGDEEFIHADTARDYTYRLLSDRDWREVQSTASVAGKTPQSVRETLEEAAQKAALAESLSAAGIDSSFPEGYENEHVAIHRVPYGLPLIDIYLDGGGAAGEIYLLLGPTGSCKTTLLQQLSIRLALSQLSIWEENNRKTSLGLVYFVTYELPKQTIQIRAVANVADIPFSVLQNRLPLSTSDTLNDRDRAMFANHLERDLFVPGEIERKRSAERRLNVNWRILDFSGLGREGRMIGGGNLEEIQQRIDADLRTVRRRGLKVHVAGVFVDYLGMMARRHCILQNLDETKYLRSILSNAPDKARRLLSYHFLCPVFMAHQVSANGNALKPGVIPDKSLSAECKTLPENCDFVFVAAKTTDDDKKLTRLNCQKARRADWQPPVTLQVQGKYARVVDVGTTWSYDDQSKTFLTVTELDGSEPLPARFQAKTKGMERWNAGRMRDD